MGVREHFSPKSKIEEGFIAQKACDGKPYLATTKRTGRKPRASRTSLGMTAKGKDKGERQERKTREKDKRERQERGGPRRPVAWVATDETAKAAASRRTPKREEDGRKELWRGGSCGPAPRPGRGKRQGGPYNGKPKSTVPSSLRAGRSDCATKRVSR